MAKYTIRVHHEPTNTGDYKFAIDFPRVETMELADGQFIPFRAWAFPRNPEAYHYIFDFEPNCPMTPNTQRPDVKSHYPEAPLICGLNTIIPFSHSFKFGVINNKGTTWLATIELATLPVLEGNLGYLFLSNDDNQSIAQYSGDKTIDSTNMTSWKNYFEEIKANLATGNIKFAFCIAPAKEFIFPDIYPIQRLSLTPQDQFIETFNSLVTIINPIKILYPERHLTYSKNDTHWTDFGAHLVAQNICERLAVSYQSPDLSYNLKITTGDLGIKYNPQRTEHCFFADRSKCHKTAYDNGIPVRGNVLIFKNTNATRQETCLIFGSSSSESIALQLTGIYSRVVRIFSGADIDWEIVNEEKPSCLLVIFASRFLVKAPTPNFSIDMEILRKLQTLNLKDLSLIRTQTESLLIDTRDKFYQDKIGRLLNFI